MTIDGMDPPWHMSCHAARGLGGPIEAKIGQSRRAVWPAAKGSLDLCLPNRAKGRAWQVAGAALARSRWLIRAALAFGSLLRPCRFSFRSWVLLSCCLKRSEHVLDHSLL